MARRKIAEAKVPTLNELILEYGPLNTECNTLKKTVADLNSKIKLAIHDAKKETRASKLKAGDVHCQSLMIQVSMKTD